MKHKSIILVVIIMVIIICPLIIAFGTSADILNWATNDNDWIGFWGSYVGTILGSGITLLVLWVTIMDNKKAREREEKIEYYNHLIQLQAELVQDIADCFTFATRLVVEQTDEVYRMMIQTQNRASMRSSEISMLLYIRKGDYNTGLLIVNLEMFSNKVDNIMDSYDKYLLGGFKDKDLGKMLDEKMDTTLKYSRKYLDEFAEIVRMEFNT